MSNTSVVVTDSNLVTVTLESGAWASFDPIEAMQLADEIQAQAGIANRRVQEKYGDEPLPAGLEEVMKAPRIQSTGCNDPLWRAAGEHLVLQWRDDQGRRCTRYAATFHEQAGHPEFKPQALENAVRALNEAGLFTQEENS